MRAIDQITVVESYFIIVFYTKLVGHKSVIYIVLTR